ncbi:MAG: nicotinate (nicotinamide) nucleotide adenylyltransferase [Pseudomonadota bacterium]|jgi:nicotinate-nucleotide adenylyltransferase
MKILFGGTFDPIHLGHIQLALHISREFAQMVHFLPLNGTPSYKAPPQASLPQRLAMLQDIVNKYPNELNLDLSEANQHNYTPTYLTLQRLQQNQTQAISFIIGGDSLVNLDSWDNWQQLFDLTNFIVAMRPQYDLSQMSARLRAQIEPRLVTQLNLQQIRGQIILTNCPELDISSTKIRQACQNNLAYQKWLEPETVKFIQQQQLYL